MGKRFVSERPAIIVLKQTSNRFRSYRPNKMRLLVLLILLLVAACSVNTEKPLSPAQEQSSSQAQSIVKLAKTLRDSKLQSNSWGVSIDEAISKDNPFAPPEFVLKSGQAPKGYKSDVGLWNCQKLEVGSFQCDYEASSYMIATVLCIHFA